MMGSMTMTCKKKKRRQTGNMQYGVYGSYDLRKVKKQKLISGLLILIITLMFNIIVNSNFARAEDDSVNGESDSSKCYKSVMLEYGDTLWGIAAEYKDIYYESAQDYIDEVMLINHLTTDQIHAGQYLTIPYYNNDCHNNEYNAKIQSKSSRWY